MADDDVKYFDESGNEVGGLLSADAAKELQEKVASLEEGNKEAETLREALKEKEAELDKLSDKEINFAALRKKSAEEKEEAMKGWSKREKELVNEMSSLREEIDTNKATSMASYEVQVLEALAGEDDDLKTKIKETSKEFVGDVKNQDDLLARYKKAYTLIKESAPSINPINQFTPSSAEQVPSGKKKRFTDTPQGQAIMGQFPHLKNKKKADK